VLARTATLWARLAGSAKIVFQSFFMLITIQPRCFASSMSSCVKRANLRIRQAIRGAVGILALRIVVQDEHAEFRRR
jgi:hypothetical protein